MPLVPGERPGVTVEQEFISPAVILEPPFLYPVIIGIARQLEVDLESDLYDSATGGPNDSGGGNLTVEAFYPDLTLNALVDAASVTVKIQTSSGIFDIDPSDVTANAPTTDKFTVATDAEYLRDIVTDATGGSGSGASTNLTDLTQRFISDQVAVGDVVQFLSGSLASTSRNVTAIVSQTVITVDGVNLPAESNISYRIERAERATGTLLVSYNAIRQDLNDELVTISDDDNIESFVGPVDPANPAGFAVSKARLNAGDKSVLFTGVSADTVAEHTRALEFLESEEVYGLVPLSQDPAVLALYEPHVDQSSVPLEKHERIAFINRQLVIREDLINVADARTGFFTNSSGEFEDDAGGSFDFNNFNVTPGDFIIYDDSGTIRELLVQAILGPTTVLINVPGSVNHPGANLASGPYTALSEAKSKTDQAQFLADYAQAFSNRRITMTWPDQAEVSFGGTLQLVPGYFLSAGVAGLVADQRPQQPLTNLSLAGFTGLRNSNNYFNESQLRILSAGGVFIHEQPVPTGPLNIRQQRTTDVSDLKKNELSIVRIIDYVAKFLRQELKPYIGRYNITPEYLDMVKVVINGLTKRLKVTTEVGPTILEGQLISIEQDEVEFDTVNIIYRIEAPFPANFIRIRLQV